MGNSNNKSNIEVENLNKAILHFTSAANNYREECNRIIKNIQEQFNKIYSNSQPILDNLNITSSVQIDMKIKRISEENFNNSYYESYSYKFNNKSGVFYIKTHFSILKLYTSIKDLVESHSPNNQSKIQNDGIDISSLQEGEELDWQKLKSLLKSIINEPNT